MTRKEIVQHFTDNINQYMKYTKNIAGEEWEDLFQTVSLMILEFPEERLISYWNPKEGLKPIFLRLLLNQYKSKTSKYHKDYRKDELNRREKFSEIILNQPQSEEEPEDILLNRIGYTLHDFYGTIEDRAASNVIAMVWDLYVQEGSLRKTLAAVPEKYADLLDLKDVHCIVKKVKRTLQESVKDYW